MTWAANQAIACVDNDLIVINHLNALLANGNPGVSVVDGDSQVIADVARKR